MSLRFEPIYAGAAGDPEPVARGRGCDDPDDALRAVGKQLVGNRARARIKTQQAETLAADPEETLCIFHQRSNCHEITDGVTGKGLREAVKAVKRITGAPHSTITLFANNPDRALADGLPIIRIMRKRMDTVTVIAF